MSKVTSIISTFLVPISMGLAGQVMFLSFQTSNQHKEMLAILTHWDKDIIQHTRSKAQLSASKKEVYTLKKEVAQLKKRNGSNEP